MCTNYQHFYCESSLFRKRYRWNNTVENSSNIWHSVSRILFTIMAMFIDYELKPSKAMAQLLPKVSTTTLIIYVWCGSVSVFQALGRVFRSQLLLHCNKNVKDMCITIPMFVTNISTQHYNILSLDAVTDTYPTVSISIRLKNSRWEGRHAWYNEFTYLLRSSRLWSEGNFLPVEWSKNRCWFS